eukprot:TRINITY_DN101793_c0_g1_i1.p1 TRINITY_DN101793_c0_g1~~TRINITY_DN101793_c0_g1_i1.p1  ORF type:complete len:188 (-),score=10.64 TRINITY_DN101793_c0_g1_i1:37-600(-)
MGFELEAVVTSNDPDILSPFDSDDLTLALDFQSGLNSSRWFQNIPSNILNILKTQNVTMNNHVYGVAIDTYKTNARLNSFYRLISTNLDRAGKEFVSTWESYKYPIYGMQWHPEKNQFEWDPLEVIDHSADAILTMQYFSNFLASQARLNNHKFPSTAAETAALIYNWSPVYTEALTDDFEQCYIFK